MGVSLADALDQAINKSTETPKEEPKKDIVEEVKEEEVVEDESLEGDALEDSSEDDEALEDEEEDALKAKPTKEEKPEVRYEKIIVDGVEQEVTIDELKRGYQKGSASGARFEKASQMLKEARALEEDVNNLADFMNMHPIAAMFEIVGEERASKALNEFHQDMIKFKDMSESERENFLLRKQMEMQNAKKNFSLDRENDVLSDEEAQVIKERLTVRVNRINEEFGFNTKELKFRLLNKIKSFASQHNTADLSLTEMEILAEQVKKEADQEWGQYLSSLDDEDLLERLGPEVVDKVRKTLLKKHKAKKAIKVEPKDGAAKKTSPKRSEEATQKSYRDFWQNPVGN